MRYIAQLARLAHFSYYYKMVDSLHIFIFMLSRLALKIVVMARQKAKGKRQE
ncbi:hypothetical protein [Aphanizomenon flos-aquae]|uniref:hypothetical protein n=1 Tax=Aphanizomenon flos-aquae TaxID=1176 RepID=UPI00190FB532|nr:hypothetical protein [Aphanizomenon flos-aquae]